MGKRLKLIRKFDEKLLAADAGYVRRTNRFKGKGGARRRVEVVQRHQLLGQGAARPGPRSSPTARWS